MKYNDEPILSMQDYESMAREYANALHKRGFIFVQVDDDATNKMVDEIFLYLGEIKACLFNLGGFLNTSSLYTLNERHIKKLRIMFDYEKPFINYKLKRDKTYCFLRYIGLECQLLRCLLALSEITNYEQEIKKLYEDRLTTLSNIFYNQDLR